MQVIENKLVAQRASWQVVENQWLVVAEGPELGAGRQDAGWVGDVKEWRCFGLGRQRKSFGS